MYATMVGGLVNALLDPIFIFAFGLGVQGAAIASLIARFSMVAVSYYGVVHIHRMLGEFDLMDFFKDAKSISVIAIPAMLTNMSSPLANAIVMDILRRLVMMQLLLWRLLGVLFLWCLAGYLPYLVPLGLY